MQQIEFAPKPDELDGAGGKDFCAPMDAGSAGWVLWQDCRTGMKSIDDSAISLVLTDPPYFIDGMDDGWDNTRLRSRIKPGVIGGLPIGMKFDRAQGRNLYKFLLPIAREWMRVIKPGGFALCFSQPRLVHHTAMAMEDAGFEIRDMLAWRYEGQPKAFKQEHFIRKRNLPAEVKERMISELEGRKTPQLKPQMELIVLAQAPRDGTYADNWLQHRAGLIDTSNPLVQPAQFPGTVIPVPKTRERCGHMTAKPVDLLRHLIRIFCARGKDATVLDSFAGSGSTGVAARLEGRGFMGFHKYQLTAIDADRRVAEATR
ncbi:MAG: site-specific DNA-methyltransferase [Chloroflexi bacterium]|nr:site-specific DNA-methyltransferase [Chloroflexota bacterium]